MKVLISWGSWVIDSFSLFSILDRIQLKRLFSFFLILIFWFLKIILLKILLIDL